VEAFISEFPEPSKYEPVVVMCMNFLWDNKEIFSLVCP
jgi:hypothetical protein